MPSRCFGQRALWAILLGLAALGCGSITLNTTFLSDQNPGSGDAGVSPLRTTFWVSGNTLYDPCAQPVVLRGINEMITFIPPPGKSGNSVYPEIAKTGANSVRIYWRTTDTASELDTALTNTEPLKLIPVIYVFNNLYTANTPTTVSNAADYWTQPDIVPVVQKHQDWLIIALREKNLTPAETANQWATNYDAAVARIRAAGIHVPLAIDAPNFASDNYGSDIDTVLSTGPNGGFARLATDPDNRLLFSVNTWSSSYTADTIATKFAAAENVPLALIVGEMSGYEQPGCPSTQFDYLGLMTTAQTLGTGWFAWSWGAVKNAFCPGGGLEMTSDGTYAGLISKAGWGYTVAVTDANSIQKKAVPAAYTPGSACPIRD